MRLFIISTAVLVSSMTFVTPAFSQYRPATPPIGFRPGTEAKGCYIHRGVEYCGSYCYWEVNGERYCQPRLRDAHSQADFL